MNITKTNNIDFLPLFCCYPVYKNTRKESLCSYSFNKFFLHRMLNESIIERTIHFQCRSLTIHTDLYYPYTLSFAVPSVPSQ